jgi:hypothetical protein
MSAGLQCDLCKYCTLCTQCTLTHIGQINKVNKSAGLQCDLCQYCTQTPRWSGSKRSTSQLASRGTSVSTGTGTQCSKIPVHPNQQDQQVCSHPVISVSTYLYKRPDQNYQVPVSMLASSVISVNTVQCTYSVQYFASVWMVYRYINTCCTYISSFSISNLI